MNELTVLSFGAGQDSTAILYKIIHDPDFRSQYVKGDLIVIMADTCNEHSHTYIHVNDMRDLCKENQIPFFFIKPKDYASGSWIGGLVYFYEQKNAVGSKAFPKTCTDNLKIRPIYKFLEKYVHDNYGTKYYGRKRAFYEFVRNNSKIRVLIGIAAKEEKRASENGSSPAKWFNECIEKVYPLITENMDRKACQDYIESLNKPVPFPSNCILCPFMSLQELLYLHRHENTWYKKWVELEEKKIQNNLHKEDKNLGVWGTRERLPEILKKAEEKYGHMSEAELIEYKMSHGHCVMSKY